MKPEKEGAHTGLLPCLTVSAQQNPKTSENTPQLKRMLEKRPETDLNKDGIVTWEEFLNDRTEQVKIIENSFKRRDKNKDGTWTKDEIGE